MIFRHCFISFVVWVYLFCGIPAAHAVDQPQAGQASLSAPAVMDAPNEPKPKAAGVTLFTAENAPFETNGLGSANPDSGFLFGLALNSDGAAIETATFSK